MRVQPGGFLANRCNMTERRWLLSAALLALLACAVPVSASSNSTVILICLGGFRWDYMSKTNTPNLDSIASNGVKAKYVKSVFPTVTLPNLYTIVTGLYSESHGIIANEMFDPVFNATFTSNTTESKWWDGGEPVWVTNQKHGFQSGASFWPGYDVKIGGYSPSYSTNGSAYSKPFASKENHMPAKERIDTVMKWLKAEKPPNFVAMYFSAADENGYKFGPDSPEIEATIRDYDSNVVRYLLDQLRQERLLDEVNIIVTSDHGMAAYNTSNFINFDDIVNASSYEFWSGNKAFFTIQPHPGKEDYVLDSLKKGQNETKSYKVYKKNDFPDDLHFKYNRRIGSIVVLMEQGWYARSSKISHGNITLDLIRGGDGYSSAIKDMYPFFVAQGPAFKKNFDSEPFELTDIYPMVCEILGIEPASNNGSLSRVKGLFREATPPAENSTSAPTPTESTPEKQRVGNKIVKIAGFVILGFAALVSIVASILLTVRWYKRPNRPKRLNWRESDETAANAANVDDMPPNDAEEHEPVDNSLDNLDETTALRGEEIQV